ncbi:signal recognition particle protein [Aestuariispira insulae]|uniref:Signal recognition particle protein n=1 Tax=Aestuariispira insulae TaxID=1461337 RepID=A0A3D9HI29_9PROT|nr:signal recognition particle protein [Aestuariispira insulae]RED49130.1 signal recognition particle subunit FFH/SRP54 (srp54) [Aestuariispira insulae]
MFDSLTSRLGSVFEGLKRRGALKEADVKEAMREVRLALLEADVALPVVKSFIKTVTDKAVGAEVLKSVTPGQQVVKIVNDALVEMLGSENTGLNLLGEPPVAIMMVGLQGSGKTTSTAKIAKRLTEKERKKVMMASLDVARPAAQEQLAVLGEQVEVKTLPIVPGQQPVDIAKRAMQAARLGGFDVVMLDTAGRLHIDDSLMDEVAAVKAAAGPSETILVADAMTGQDAVTVADSFHKRIGLSGIMLTRIDGDARGGAALSMRQVTDCPIKFLGTGEKMDELEEFHADRIAGRILGMGDVVSLVEKAAETIEQEEAEALAKKMQKGEFDLDDMAKQLKQMRKMGGMEGLMGMLPGVGKMKQQMAGANIDDKMILRQEAIISSMTKKERQNPKVIHASRKKRIAAGSGTSVQDVNKLLKQHLMMSKMMKKVSKLGKKGFMRSLGNMMPPNMMPPGGMR